MLNDINTKDYAKEKDASGADFEAKMMTSSNLQGDHLILEYDETEIDRALDVVNLCKRYDVDEIEIITLSNKLHN